MNSIYVAQYNTESGDDGVAGYWEEEPSEEQLTEFFKKYMPDEFFNDNGDEYRTVGWDVHELKLVNIGNGIPQICSI